MAAARVSSTRRVRRAAVRNTNRIVNRPKNNNAVAASGGGGTQRQERKRGRPRAAHPPVIILPVPSNNPFDRNDAPQFALERGIMDPFAIRYLFKKELKFSDVSSACRIVIPKKYAEIYFPALKENEGVFLNMDDTDGRHVWSFKYRYWPNNHSRMYLLEYTGEFVKTHNLTLGDVIYIYKDVRHNRFVIEAQKCPPPPRANLSSLNEASATAAARVPAVPQPFAAPELINYIPAPYFTIINEDYFMGDSAAITATLGDFPTAPLSGGSLPEMPPLERVSSFGSLSFSIDDFP